MFVGIRYIQFFLLLFLASSWTSDNAELPVLDIQSAKINHSIVSSDGQSILMASGSQILVWDINKKQILQRYYSTERNVVCISQSNDGLWLTAGYDNGAIVLWDAKTYEVIHEFDGHTNAISNIQIHGGAGIIASGDQIGNIKTWDITSGTMKKNVKAHDAPITAIDISADAQLLLTASKDATAKIWQLNEKAPAQNLVGHLSEINSACFLNGNIILTGSNDKTISAWNIQTGEIAHTLLGHKSNIIGTQPMIGQGKFITSSDDGEIIVWDSKTMKELDRFDLDDTKVRQIGVHKNTLFPLHSDQSISVWDLNEQKRKEVIQIGSTPVLAGNVFNGNNFIIVGDETGTIKKHELSNGDLIQHFKGHDKAINQIVNSPDGTTFATSANDKIIKIWDSQTGELLKTLEGHKSSVLALAFSLDGEFLYSGGKGKVIKWWNLSSGVEINSFKAHGSDITKLIALEDNRVISVSKDRKMKIHHVEKGLLESEIGAHAESISSAVFIPKDSLLYVGDVVGNISSYHIGQKIQMERMKGHSGNVNSLCLNEDFTYLLSSSEDKTSNIWHLPSSNLEHTFSGHKAPLSYCSFGKDENTIITTSLDKQIKVWSIQEFVQR